MSAPTHYVLPSKLTDAQVMRFCAEWNMHAPDVRRFAETLCRVAGTPTNEEKADDTARLILPDEMTPDIEKALGIICYNVIEYARAFRAGGETIRGKAEAEQANIVFKVLKGVLRTGSFDQAWRDMHRAAYEAQERAARGVVVTP